MKSIKDLKGFIEWSEKYEIGHDVIDQQHRYLVGLINRLHKGRDLGWTPMSSAEILDELQGYCVFHFKEEENLFLASDYPDKEIHIDQHRGFILKYLDFEKYVRKEGEIPDELFDYLKKWLQNHILNVDQGLSKYIK